jgi:carboxymethylenebutenolidase
MVEQESYIDTTDGRMDIFEVYPHAEGRYGTVLFYMDAPGIREELRDMARRIAAEGYLVILPNLYYRQTQASCAGFAEAPFNERTAYARHINNRLILRDTEAMLGYVDCHPCADATSIGILGFCMSGAFVLAAAGTYPAHIRCAASVYGVNLVTESEDSPHLLADRVAGELYFACAEDDNYVPGDVIRRLDAHLAGTAANFCIDWYPGTRHGFAFADREDDYDRVSAERLWKRLFALFKRNLHPPADS